MQAGAGGSTWHSSQQANNISDKLQVQHIYQGRKLSFMPNIIDMELDQRYLKLTDFVCNQYTLESS